MIGYLRGKVAHLDESTLIVDVQGVGYQTFVPASVWARAQVGDSLELWIHTHVREQSLDLYGFGSLRERDVFEALISISGLGSKTALSILSQVDMERFIAAVSVGRIETLGKIKGVSETIAARINKELGKKFKNLGIAAQASSEKSGVGGSGVNHADMLSQALLGLGYREKDFLSVLEKIDSELPIGQQIKEALSYLSRGSEAST